MPAERVLVVGTTADYIDWIRVHHPQRALFLTDARHRASAAAPAPHPAEELLVDLERPAPAHRAALRDHLAAWPARLSGIACFDCESLLLAAHLARGLRLPYHAPEAVAAARNKLRSKELWHAAGVPCPAAARIVDEDQAVAFLGRHRPAVLKPLSGSGSELIFLCRDAGECRAAFRTIASRIRASRNARMYARDSAGADGPDPREVFLMEAFVAGPEYSSDFLLEESGARLIRVAGKVMDTGGSLGTALAYALPAALPPPLDEASLLADFAAAARALGISRGLVMVDFIVRDGRPCLLEMTPRPGGDCLPPLIRRSSGLDMLGLALDVAAGWPPRIPAPDAWRPLAGARLIARREGTLAEIDDRLLRDDPRVLECHWTARPGHAVRLPPADYDSRILGHVIFAPSGGDLARECRELLEPVRVEIRAQPEDPGPARACECPREVER
ncbi:MAG: ATP-grasp domain-containing protein [Candidatus Eisenbacteria bacterium]|uniref:ATP-grasp domain-containing protein n=1 Tax=Eiseniibacteriota bacterium TaxID=2212470 RepID=A0A937X6N8_UNCEI|nr:ATP-grasp domain-containing protein [Candidatus Eisenbacteria bacterium]